ncbi:MAG: acyltransferase [Dechloromonas sp.]|nr:acyltransferase [Dechloromonas sp.]
MQTIPSPRGFRGDVNGLRAWAVMAVILYHFGVPGFGGGFVGVDVFFVISGFLMTGIVIKGLEQGSFSVLAFYGARIRRIVPALLGLCFFLLVLGYAVLSPPDYKTLATHALSAISFVSNFKFWDEAGYFDISSHEKWLLHTWSLSVEWQFYLLLPLLLSAVWRLKPGRLPQIYVLLACTVISLGLSVALTDSYPTTAFFLGYVIFACWSITKLSESIG